MKKEEVNFVRLIADEGKSLKVKQRNFNYSEKKYETSYCYGEKEFIADMNVVESIEEIPHEQYLEETKNFGICRMIR